MRRGYENEQVEKEEGRGEVKQQDGKRMLQAAESPRSSRDDGAAPVRVSAARVQRSLQVCQAASLLCAQLDPSRSAAVRLIELAEQLSELRDETVLLIDADVRRRHATAELGLQAEAGLTEYLGVGRPANSVVRPRVRERLDVLPTGRGWLGDSRRIHSAIADLLQRVGRHRLVLVVAGPPDDPLTEAFQRCCHAAVLVLQSGVSERERALGAVSDAARGGGRLLGALVA